MPDAPPQQISLAIAELELEAETPHPKPPDPFAREDAAIEAQEERRRQAGYD